MKLPGLLQTFRNHKKTLKWKKSRANTRLMALSVRLCATRCWVHSKSCHLHRPSNNEIITITPSKSLNFRTGWMLPRKWARKGNSIINSILTQSMEFPNRENAAKTVTPMMSINSGCSLSTIRNQRIMSCNRKWATRFTIDWLHVHLNLWSIWFNKIVGAAGPMATHSHSGTWQKSELNLANAVSRILQIIKSIWDSTNCPRAKEAHPLYQLLWALCIGCHRPTTNHPLTISSLPVRSTAIVVGSLSTRWERMAMD